MSGTAARPRRRRWAGEPASRQLKQVGARLLGPLCFIALLQLLGVGDAVDGVLRRAYYEVRGQRDGGHDLLFVAIDDSTVEAWGPPPWSWKQYEETIGALIDGGARGVAILEPGPRLLPSAEVPASLARAEAKGVLFMPPAIPGFRQPKLVLGTNGVVEAVELGRADRIESESVTRTVIERLGLERGERGSQLPVNFYGPPDSLPTLPAHRVATGEIPLETFRGRVVVIGLRGERFAPQVPTPVGPMSPAEIHAHALLGLLHGVAWHSPPPWSRWLLIIGLCILGVFVVPRMRTYSALVALAALGSALLITDYLLFASGRLLLGAGMPLIALAAGSAAGWLAERLQAQHNLERLTGWFIKRLRLDAFGRMTSEAEDYWYRVAEASKTYVDYDSTVLALLPERGWHLEFRALVDTTSDAIYEMRRDIRRAPYKEAYQLHRPVWSTRQFMADEELRTLIVPLIAFDRLRGMWLINIDRKRNMTDEDLRVVQMLAQQMTIAAERHHLNRSQRAIAPAANRGSLLATQIDEARLGALALVNEQEGLNQTFSTLPVGVLVANIWGELELINESMSRFLQSAGIDQPRLMSLHALLARLTNTPEGAVRDVLKDLVRSPRLVRLEGSFEQSLEVTTRYELLLRRLGSTSGKSKPHSEDSPELPARSHFALAIWTHVETHAETADWRWGPSAAPRVLDPRQVVRDAIEELRTATVTPTRPLVVEMPAQVSKVAGDALRVGGALRDLLSETMRQGPADQPGRVVVGEDAKSVTIEIIDPATTLPGSDVASIKNGAPAEQFPEDSWTARIAAARATLEESNGSLQIESDLSDGTRLVIRIPKTPED